MSSNIITTDGSFLQRTSPLQQNMLRVLLYFDIFHYPLSVDEIYAFLPSNSTSREQILGAGRAGPLAEVLTHDGKYFFLRTSDNSCVVERERNERRARRRRFIARLMAKLISQFPFVRGVFVSGELSKGVASKKSDIDFVIITAENRLWISRTLLILFKKLILFNSKKYFCLNYFVTEDHLTYHLRNFYSAIEIATLKPLVNPELFQRYVRVNGWIQQFLPNWEWEGSAVKRARPSGGRVQRSLESLFPQRLADRIDDMLLLRWRNVWKRRYAHLPADQRERLFSSEKFLSTAFGEDFLLKILNAYHVRLERFGLSFSPYATPDVSERAERDG